MTSAYGKHNISLSAAMNSVDKVGEDTNGCAKFNLFIYINLFLMFWLFIDLLKNLKKRRVIVKMSRSRPKSPSTELEFEGTVEELRKDKKMYQKTAMLHLRFVS